jgi:hypothetical protein
VRPDGDAKRSWLLHGGRACLARHFCPSQYPNDPAVTTRSHRPSDNSYSPAPQTVETPLNIANWVRFICILCLATAGVTSAQAQIQPHEEFICTSGPVKRVVSIVRRNASSDTRQSGSCRVDYTKDGDTRTVWTSQKDYAYCVAKAISLVTKLVEGNFSCKPQTTGQPDESDVPENAPAPSDGR